MNYYQNLQQKRNRKAYLVNLEAKGLGDASFSKEYANIGAIPEFNASEYKILIVDNPPFVADKGLF